MPSQAAASAGQRDRAQERQISLARDGVFGISEIQRSRILSSAVQIVMEQGYGQMSVARVTGGAGVSRRTFYELFEDRESCFLAAFDQAVAELSDQAKHAWQQELLWSDRVRAALTALLELLDEHPGIASLVVVEALGAGPRVLAHRAEVVSHLAELVDQGRSQTAKSHQPPPLTAEGVVGAVFGVIHARLLENPPRSLTKLLGPLMALIVAPYLGHAQAAREVQRCAPRAASRLRVRPEDDPFEGLKMRVTYRTVRVLAVIAEQPGTSNRQIADEAGIADQGQISRLLTRLETLGLIDNTTAEQPTGEPNQWRLTPRGHEIHQSLLTKSTSLVASIREDGS
jgi:AcrR family transcriptional regulator/DNA-binding MarR family transcriptional regulator